MSLILSLIGEFAWVAKCVQSSQAIESGANAILDLRRAALRDVWWGREAVSHTSTTHRKLLMWNELISEGTDTLSNRVFQSEA